IYTCVKKPSFVVIRERYQLKLSQEEGRERREEEQHTQHMIFQRK
ncbi:MAG: hypothetical protein ACI8RD_001705, partial [Bacillariaceae sp.]